MKSAITVIRQASIVIITARAGSVDMQRDGGVHQHGSQNATQVLAAASSLGIDRLCYARYAAKRWGSDWVSQAECCREALDQIGRYRHDPEGLIDKIEVELRAVERIGR
jgi:hypothetical protein